MHRAFFGIKMVHWRVVGITARRIAGFGLTPARFDLMRIALNYPDGIPQNTIRWLLGVAASTVSRMLTALEKLGFIRRERQARDRRYVDVYITERGAKATDGCLVETVYSDKDRHFASLGVLGQIWTPPACWEDTLDALDAGREKLETLGELLANMRKSLEDQAPYADPWRENGFLEPLVFITDADGNRSYKETPSGNFFGY